MNQARIGWEWILVKGRNLPPEVKTIQGRMNG